MSSKQENKQNNYICICIYAKIEPMGTKEKPFFMLQRPGFVVGPGALITLLRGETK